MTWIKPLIVAGFLTSTETSRSPPSCSSSNTYNHLPACQTVSLNSPHLLLYSPPTENPYHIFCSAIERRSQDQGARKLKFQIFFIKNDDAINYSSFVESPKPSSLRAEKTALARFRAGLPYCTVRQRKAIKDGSAANVAPDIKSPLLVSYGGDVSSIGRWHRCVQASCSLLSGLIMEAGKKKNSLMIGYRAHDAQNNVTSSGVLAATGLW